MKQGKTCKTCKNKTIYIELPGIGRYWKCILMSEIVGFDKPQWDTMIEDWDRACENYKSINGEQQ